MTKDEKFLKSGPDDPIVSVTVTPVSDKSDADLVLKFLLAFLNNFAHLRTKDSDLFPPFFFIPVTVAELKISILGS